MVATSQPLATQAGLETLQRGGTAADAAIACAAMLGVTEPCSTGLGGDFFALYYEADTQRVTALNGSGRAPRRLTLELLREQGLGPELPPYHAHAVTVPGACSGWCALHERYGKLPLAEVLAPATHAAEEGFPVAPLTSHTWNSEAERKLRTALGGQTLLISGQAPRPGQLFRNPDLARVLRSIGAHGADAYYRGPIGRAVAEAVQRAGGVLEVDDLARHSATWDEPISTVYQGIRLYECPPNGQGLTAILALNLIAQLDLPSLGDPLSAGRWHHLIEVFRLAFADARWFIADPVHSPVPLQELLSAGYARARARLIDPQRAVLDRQQGSPWAGSDTVYFSVVDGQGNACSVVNSNYQGFGTGIVPIGTGFSLQNRGMGFSLDPEHPNALAPGKRPYHTIIPAMSTREADNSLFASFGVMGGFMQPQGHVQVFLALVADGLDPQAALDRPRFCLEQGTANGQVALEEGLPLETMSALAEMGHAIRPVSGYGRSTFGRGQVIQRDPVTGVLAAGSDPRADGCALGF